MKIEILRNSGMAAFQELLYLDGTPTNAKLLETKWGWKYLVYKPDRSREYVDPNVRPQTLERKGYKLDNVAHPAWAKLDGTGRGMAGMMSVYVRVYKTPVNYINFESEKQAEIAAMR